ncbi:MAG: hypothetical protein JWO35_855 [Candidatus Saccharibacteria bacterium]|nr:hypothetical protein [Candidatus Saccharibacteria bacterium]
MQKPDYFEPIASASQDCLNAITLLKSDEVADKIEGMRAIGLNGGDIAVAIPNMAAISDSFEPESLSPRQRRYLTNAAYAVGNVAMRTGTTTKTAEMFKQPREDLAGMSIIEGLGLEREVNMEARKAAFIISISLYESESEEFYKSNG